MVIAEVAREIVLIILLLSADGVPYEKLVFHKEGSSFTEAECIELALETGARMEKEQPDQAALITCEEIDVVESKEYT